MSSQFDTASLYYKPQSMAMTIIPMEIIHAEQLCRWKYDAPYRMYEWPSWERMQKDGIEFGDPVLRQQQYKAIVDAQEQLLGFAQLFPIVGVTRIGLGLRPDLCSRGIGPSLTSLITREAFRLSPGNAVDLEVLTWNHRAIRAYQKAGFIIEDTYIRATPRGAAEFHCMVFQPQQL